MVYFNIVYFLICFVYDGFGKYIKKCLMLFMLDNFFDI